MDILSQKTMPWGNILLGKSKYYIHAYGAALTELAEILGLTPDVVNNKLIEVDGFGPDETGEPDQIIWEKIVPAFPGWSAQFITPYNNEFVVDALSKGQGVIVFVEDQLIAPNILHAVRYIGEGKCHDPFSGTERPTSDFPNVKSFVVLTKTPEVPAEEPKGPQQPATEGQSVTLANLPQHEKQAILAHLETATAEIKKLLAL